MYEMIWYPEFASKQPSVVGEDVDGTRLAMDWWFWSWVVSTRIYTILFIIAYE